MSYYATPQPAWIPVRPRWQRWAFEPAPATPVKWKVSPTDGTTPRLRRSSAPEYVNNINRGTSAFVPSSRSRQIQQELKLTNGEHQPYEVDSRPPLEKKTSSPRRYDWAELFGKQRRFSDSYFLESLPETTRMRRHSLLLPQPGYEGAESPSSAVIRQKQQKLTKKRHVKS
ncbi:hypothetical protein EXIGLDRAFT_720638 [Exidia glandulosa HHB12029]|uniref:Uncharacterized protein n=1 Tax=Exidia glandulosa HHB12029 TaxID=1314781 RepID=A0A165G8Z3_EXIGL|nr:hypothetical protein EXIGLDRAFT_720638 [Exidia glandulosa HHB12029]